METIGTPDDEDQMRNGRISTLLDPRSKITRGHGTASFIEDDDKSTPRNRCLDGLCLFGFVLLDGTLVPSFDIARFDHVDGEVPSNSIDEKLAPILRVVGLNLPDRNNDELQVESVGAARGVVSFAGLSSLGASCQRPSRS